MRRIILADPDLNYLIKLQVKFVQKLQDSYEVEAISDHAYLNELLSVPQRATCIVINEEWLVKDLSKHDIDYIIPLTTKEGGVSRFASTEEIFNQVRNIIGFSSNSTTKLESGVLIFNSAVGGAGKTVLSLGLAMYLSNKHYRVLYVNTETIQSFQYYLKNKALIPNDIAITLQYSDPFKSLEKHIKTNGFDFLPPFEMLLFSYGIDEDFYTSFINGAKASGNYDFIIIDSRSGVNTNTAKQIALADKVIFITNPGKNNKFAMHQFLKQIDLSSEKIIKICNKSPAPDPETDEYIGIQSNLDSATLESFANSNHIEKIALAIS